MPFRERRLLFSFLRRCSFAEKGEGGGGGGLKLPHITPSEEEEEEDFGGGGGGAGKYISTLAQGKDGERSQAKLVGGGGKGGLEGTVISGDAATARECCKESEWVRPAVASPPPPVVLNLTKERGSNNRWK